MRAQSTFYIGPTLGGNLATQHFADNPSAAGYHLDWLAGAQASVGGGKFAVQPALLFSQKGYTYTYTVDYRDAYNLPLGTASVHNNVRLSYLTLPVNFCFVPLGRKNGPQLFAGPYVSVLLSARNVHTDTHRLPTDATVTDDLAVAETLDASTGRTGLRRFDAGLQGGVGYRAGAWLVQLNYSVGLRTTAPTYTYYGTAATTSGAYNRSFQASLAYLFSNTK